MNLRDRKNENDETKVFPTVPQNERVDYQWMAKDLVRKVIEDASFKQGRNYDVYIVWFCKTLQNWKALICTTLPDGMYYEVTHNGDLRETYVDTYVKTDNRKFLDREI